MSVFCLFKQKTAYEMRISDWSSDVCSSDLNLLTREKVLQGVAEVREGISFCLSLPLDLRGGTKLNPRRHPPQLKPVIREGEVAFNLALGKFHPQLTDVNCDDYLLLYNQYSTTWDRSSEEGRSGK